MRTCGAWCEGDVCAVSGLGGGAACCIPEGEWVVAED